MIGSIIGDIIGSYYEVLEIKGRNYEDRIKIFKETMLVSKNSSYTDDSVLTTAIMDSLLNDKDYNKYLRMYGNKELNLGIDKYGRSRFGKGFTSWLSKNEEGCSYGNGSAMRVAPIGFYFNNLEEVKKNAYLATIPSHNHIEAIKAAEAIAVIIFLIRQGYSKEDIKKHIEDNYYKLDYNLEELQKNYKFSSKCINSVPQAIYCFIVSDSFTDAMKKCISIGGDTDTICAIAGGMCEAYYGIDENLYQQVKPFIPNYIMEIINKFYKNKTKTFK